ncbi:MAG TPA: paraslipin [Verrucomicrobiales bacterium]|nr:paraslipin [Verrucomicrobiales bacterium]HIL69819.1 paraslipin [Verrucomicrobiota bacterium]
MTYVTITVLVLLFFIWKTFIIVPMRSSYIKEKLGKFDGVLEPGFHFLIPFIDRVAYRHEIREQVMDIPAQTCITGDNIQVLVDGLVYIKVMDPKKASYGIGDYRNASINLAQTTMRSEVGKLALHESFSERDKLNENIVREIDRASDPWGIKVLRYEVKNITPSEHVVQTLEKQMEAVREKRADIIMAEAHRQGTINISEGERQEAINLSEGAKQKRINEANGKAREISIIAEATAKGIKRVAEATTRPGGAEAIKMRITEEFIQDLGEILEKSTITVLPGQAANLKAAFEGISQVTSKVTQS